MKHKITRSIRTGNRFRKEFRRQIRMLIIVTLGFTIAFTWRQTLFDVSQFMVNLFLHIQDSTALSILTSLFITLLSVLLVYLTAHFLKDGFGEH